MMGHQWRSEYDRTAIVVLQCGDEPRYSTGASPLTSPQRPVESRTSEILKFLRRNYEYPKRAIAHVVEPALGLVETSTLERNDMNASIPHREAPTFDLSLPVHPLGSFPSRWDICRTN